MSGLAVPAAPVGWSAGSPLRRELVKVSAFFIRNWRMTYRNAFTLFEIVFWPIVNLLSVGLLITFLDAEPGTVVFVLVGTFALSTVQVCQLDVAYAALFDMWAKSIKHQLVAPIRPWHLVLGSWLMGLVRGTAVFVLQAAVSHWVFGVSVLAHGVAPAVALLAGLLLSAAGVGLLVSTLLMLFGLRAEVSAWSGVSLVLLLCGVYYPVSILPGAAPGGGRGGAAHPLPRSVPRAPGVRAGLHGAAPSRLRARRPLPGGRLRALRVVHPSGAADRDAPQAVGLMERRVE